MSQSPGSPTSAASTCSDEMLGSVSSSNTSAATPSGDSASDAQICRCDKKHPTAPSEPHHAFYITSAHTTRVDCRPPLHVETKAVELRDRHRHAVRSLVEVDDVLPHRPDRNGPRWAGRAGRGTRYSRSWCEPDERGERGERGHDAPHVRTVRFFFTEQLFYLLPDAEEPRPNRVFRFFFGPCM
jgi:hypothetical protein